MPDSDRRLSLPSDRDATGRDLGEPELQLLRQAIESGHLNSTGGTLVPRFETEFAARFGKSHAVACANGSAAVHAALGALDLKPGDEVISTPITDMGAVLPIHYEGARAVFADVDPFTGNVTAQTLSACITSRTRALIVTHLFGMPCEMAPIRALASEHGLPVIEDCAQAFLAEDGGELVGSHSDYACYSFQQGKHMTTGEGGMVVCADEERADLVKRYINKGWGYGDAKPDHDRRGQNFRMTELQAAVGIAQLDKLGSVVSRREAAACQLGEALKNTAHLQTPFEFWRPGTRHAFWRFPLTLSEGLVQAGGLDLVSKQLASVGIYNAPRYIQKPAFDCSVFDRHNPRSVIAIDDPVQPDCPGARTALSRMIVLPWNEHYTTDHVRRIAEEVLHALEICTGSRDAAAPAATGNR